MPRLKAAHRRVHSAESASNGRAKKIHIVTGAGSRRIWRVPLDGRSVEARIEKAQVDELVAHLGGESEVTAPMMGVIQSVARASALEALAWCDVVRRGVLIEGQANPVADLLLRAMRAKTSALQMIGLQRVSRELTLGDVLRADIAQQRAQQAAAADKPEGDDT